MDANLETKENQTQALWDEMANERTSPAAEEPPQAVAEESPPAPEAQVTPEPAAELPQPDPILTEIREQLARLSDRQRNVEGHIGGLKHQQQSLIDELKAATVARSNVTEAPSQSEVSQAIQSPAEWESLKADYPEWALATEKLLDSRLSTVKPAQPSFTAEQVAQIVDERVKGMSQQLRVRVVEDQLDGLFPDWKDEVRSTQFDSWLKAQPSEVQALERSEQVKDAVKLLRAYEASKAVTDPIVDARAKKLAAAAALPKGMVAPKTKSVDEMSPEELWDYESRKREKQRKEQGY